MMRAALQKIAGDRFFLFLLVGAALFGLDAVLPERDAREVVVIGPGELAMLQARRRAQWGEEAGAEQLQALLDAHLREEILVREALRRGLDRGDVIVRRRLAQKMAFLLRDEAGEPAISEAEAAAWFAARRTAYREPKRVAFRHIFMGEGPQAEAEAAALLARLPALLRQSQAGWRGLGKPFAAAREQEARSQDALSGLFGVAFAERLLQEERAGAWWGPLRSAYGVHLLQTTRVLPARTPPFAEVREQVLGALRRIRREEREAQAFDRLLGSYRVRWDIDIGPNTTEADTATEADGSRRDANGRESENTGSGRMLESSGRESEGDAADAADGAANGRRVPESAVGAGRESENTGSGRTLEGSGRQSNGRESEGGAADGADGAANGRRVPETAVGTGRASENTGSGRTLEGSGRDANGRESENTGADTNVDIGPGDA